MRRKTILLLTLLFATMSGCNQVPHKTHKAQAQRHWNHVRSQIKLQLAGQQLTARQFDAAAQTASEAIGLDPTEASGYVLLSRAQLELGDMLSAQRTVEAARLAGIWTSELAYAQGIVAEQRNDLSGALRYYHEARTAGESADADHIAAEAECLVALNRPEEALALLDEFADRFPGDATLGVLGAHVCALMHNEADAIRRYREASLLVGRSDLVAEEFGLLLVRAGQYAEGLGVLMPLDQQGDEMSGSLRRALATCQLELGAPQTAVRLLKQYADDHPHDTRAQVLLAKAAIAADQTATAIHSIAIAQRAQPGNPEIALVRAVIQWRQHDYTSAALSLQRVLEVRPDDVDAHCLLADVLAAQGQQPKAAAHLRRALQIDPGCLWAQVGLRKIEDATARADRTTWDAKTGSEMTSAAPRP